MLDAADHGCGVCLPATCEWCRSVLHSIHYMHDYFSSFPTHVRNSYLRCMRRQSVVYRCFNVGMHEPSNYSSRRARDQLAPGLLAPCSPLSAQCYQHFLLADEAHRVRTRCNGVAAVLPRTLSPPQPPTTPCRIPLGTVAEGHTATPARPHSRV